MDRAAKAYIGLSGREMIDVILHKARVEFEKYDHLFGAGRAYHNPRVQLAVKVDCYTPEGTPDVGGWEQVFDLGGIIYEPDRAREEAGIGTYETRLVDDGIGRLADVKGEPLTTKVPVPDPLSPENQAIVEKVNKIMEEDNDLRGLDQRRDGGSERDTPAHPSAREAGGRAHQETNGGKDRDGTGDGGPRARVEHKPKSGRPKKAAKHD